MPYLDLPQKKPQEEGMNTLHQTNFGSPTQVPSTFEGLDAMVGMPQAPEGSPQAQMEAPAPSQVPGTPEKGPEDYRKQALRNIQNRFRGESQGFVPVGLEK